MRARFHAEPIVQATELLLQERTPRDVAVAHPRAEEVQAARHGRATRAARRCGASRTPHDATPRTHLLSNGRYAVMLTAAGSGYSRWRDLAVTRWREDATRDDWGTLRLPARRPTAATVWSAGYQPSGVEPDSYDVIFAEDRAEFIAPRRHAHDDARGAWSRRRTTPRCAASRSRTAAAATREIERHLLRRARAGAAGRRRRASGLLQAVRRRPSIVAGARRARWRRAGGASPDEPEIWAAHLAVVEGEAVGEPRVRDRPRALPRPRPRASRDADRGDRRPAAVRTRSAPCSIRLRLRRRVRIAAGRHGAHRLLDAGRVLARARCSTSSTSIATPTPSSAPRRWPGRRRRCSCAISASMPDEASLFQRLAGHVALRRPVAAAVVRHDPARRRRPAGALGARASPATCRSCCVRIDEVEDLDIVRQLLRRTSTGG